MFFCFCFCTRKKSHKQINKQTKHDTKMVKQKEDTEQKTDRKRQSDIERERRQGSTVGYFNNVEYLQQRQIDTRHVLYVTRGREDNARSTLISTSNIYYILGQSVMWKCVERKLEF